MALVTDMRILQDAGILAARGGGSPSLELKQLNLIYGFNGSGKSTLSRLFAALQFGGSHPKLPPDCKFEVDLSDGTTLSYPDRCGGLESSVCVFNADFIADNLRWDLAAANPVIYLGADQAQAVDELKRVEAEILEKRGVLDSDVVVLQAKERAFADFKRLAARTIAERIRQSIRYEATQFVSDVERLGASQDDVLTPDALDAVTSVCGRTETPQKLAPISFSKSSLVDAIEAARTLVPLAIEEIAVEALRAHPEMVPWVRHGHEYHQRNGLQECLYCGAPITSQRDSLLAKAFSGQFESFTRDLAQAVKAADGCLADLTRLTSSLPRTSQLSPDLQSRFEHASGRLIAVIETARAAVSSSLISLKERQSNPTRPAAAPVPAPHEVEALVTEIDSAVAAVNTLLLEHSEAVAAFDDHRNRAREAVRRHFVASFAREYTDYVSDVGSARDAELASRDRLRVAEQKAAELRSAVRAHGPAAEKINALIRSYLGHGELSIRANDAGYELQRHGVKIDGLPSEGEKTAIALCYFLTTLEADNRKLKDLLIIVDDPVSSLDTKAMNFACTLIRSRLSGARQLVVLTHNAHCMNELKKSWKSFARPKPDVAATASLKFIDVTAGPNGAPRSATLIELPKHLREYDSEYHFLFEKVFRFEASRDEHFDYAFMMPNVLRRVLETFLAFKVPVSGPLADKLKILQSRHRELDLDRLHALERLCQVESHSDSLDDLIAHSSMTVEESRDANAALIGLVGIADPQHLADFRKYCG